MTRRIGSSGGGARASSSLERAVMGRKKEKKGVATPLYSREDIREQYCINSKEIEVLERSGRTGRGIFGCLSSHKVRPSIWLASASHIISSDYFHHEQTAKKSSTIEKNNGFIELPHVFFYYIHSCFLFCLPRFISMA